MPCYDPVATDRQKRAYMVKQFLRETEGFVLDWRAAKEFLSSYDALGISDADLDRNTEILCNRLKVTSREVIKDMSLELQLWWREHQELDRKRAKKGR